MAKKPETRFKEKVLKDLRALPKCWAEKIQQVGKRGTPDILVCLNGSFIALELKKDAKECADSLQRHKLKAIELAGGTSVVACPETWRDTRDLLCLTFIPDEPFTSEH